MTRLALAALTLLISGSALAQPPQEVTARDVPTIRLMPDQVRVFRFDEAVASVSVPVENLVEITPRSEHTFEFHAVKRGEAMVTASDASGHIVQSLLVRVGPNVVKIYRPDVANFIQYECTNTGCDNGDAGPSNGKSSTSRSVTSPTSQGGWVTNTVSSRND